MIGIVFLGGARKYSLTQLLIFNLKFCNIGPDNYAFNNDLAPKVVPGILLQQLTLRSRLRLSLRLVFPFKRSSV